MNLIEVLVRLRDDMRLWVTNNLNALNAKIDEKTIPIDDKLDFNSTNPVQNKIIAEAVGIKPVSEQIAEAVNNKKYSYSELKDAPSISENEENAFMITDKQGNIVFRVDEEGTHTTNITMNHEAIATKSFVQDLIQNVEGGENAISTEYVDSSIQKLKTEIGENIVGSEENFSVMDTMGNIIFKIDHNGIHTTNISLNGRNIVDFLNNIVPMKGKDYWTEEDKKEVINEVLDSLSLWEGGSY